MIKAPKIIGDIGYTEYVESLKAKYPGAVALSLPLPPAGVTAQQGVQRFVKSAATKKQREQAHLIVKALRLPQITKKVRIHHVWFCAKNNYEAQMGGACPKKHKMYRPQDEANATQALKGAVDGLIDAGLLIDDRRQYVTWGDFERLGTAKENFGKCGVLLFLEVIG